MSVRLIGLLAIALGTAGCAPRTADRAAEEQAIRALSARWLEAVQRRDASAIAAPYDEDSRLLWAGGDTVIGKAAIEKTIGEELEANPSQTVEWSPDRVEVSSSGDLAVELGTQSIMNGGADGSGEAHERYATVYRKRNGEWKVVADVSNSVPFVKPPPGGKAESALRARITALESAWNARDAAALAAMYAPDGESTINGTPRYSGREDNQKMYSDLFAGLPPKCRIHFDVSSSRLLQPAVGLVNTAASFEGCTGLTPDRGLWVLERSDGQWLVAALRVGAAESATGK